MNEKHDQERAKTVADHDAKITADEHAQSLLIKKLKLDLDIGNL